MKMFDLVAVVGTYEKDGATKKRYLTVGAVHKSKDGDGQFVVLSRSFNPAGVPFKDGGDSIILSCFEPREKEGSGKGKGTDDLPF